MLPHIGQFEVAWCSPMLLPRAEVSHGCLTDRTSENCGRELHSIWGNQPALQGPHYRNAHFRLQKYQLDMHKCLFPVPALNWHTTQS